MEWLTFHECIDHYLSEQKLGREALFKIVDYRYEQNDRYRYIDFLVRGWKPLISSFKDEDGGDVYLYLDCDILASYPNALFSNTIKINEDLICTQANVIKAEFSDLLLYVGGDCITEEGKKYFRRSMP